MKELNINFKNIASTLTSGYIQDNAFVQLEADLKPLSESLVRFLNLETKTIGEQSVFRIRTGSFNFAELKFSGLTFKLYASKGNVLLEINAEPASIGLIQPAPLVLEEFQGDWESAWQTYESHVIQAQENEFKSTCFIDDLVIRKDDTVISVLGFSYGTFGVGSTSKSNTVASLPEAKWLAERFGKESGFKFEVIRPSKFQKPFTELTTGYVLSVPVQKINSDKQVYSFFNKKELQFEILECTNFGDEVRVDKVRDRDSGWTYQAGIASVHTDIISAHINRYER